MISRRRRVLGLASAVATLAVLVGAATASAHPLGNFSTNHLTQVRVSADRVDLRWILDQAEVPTFRERRDAPGEVLQRKRAAALAGLELTVDGRRVALRPGRAAISFPGGQGGLKTTRVELALSAPAEGARRVELRDRSFPDRVGWKAIVAAPGRGTAARSSVPAGDPTNGLRRYPDERLNEPLDQRAATFAVSPGAGTLQAPDGERAGATADGRGSSDGFAGIFDDAAAGQGVLVLLLLAALGWGALHALSPGHGKAMVAAYLVGTRGTARDAIVLGATVTVTHTIGVFALGFVALGLSEWILPETLYPWLNLISGLLVVGVGAAVLRARLRDRSAGDGHDHGHHHSHGLFGHHHHHHGHTHGPDSHTHGGDTHTHAAQSHAAVAEHAHEPLVHAHAGHAHDDSAHAHEPLVHAHDHADHADVAPHALVAQTHQPHTHDHAAAANGYGHHAHDHAAHNHANGNGNGNGHHAHNHGDHSPAAHAADGHDHVHVHALEDPRDAAPEPEDAPTAREHRSPMARRSLIAVGAAAGLIPCPSALVVLLGAIAQQQIALGLLLIVAFSLGLAATLTALGLAVVLASGRLSRLPVPGGLIRVLPAVSAVVIIGVGVVLTLRALPQLG